MIIREIYAARAAKSLIGFKVSAVTDDCIGNPERDHMMLDFVGPSGERARLLISEDGTVFFGIDQGKETEIIKPKNIDEEHINETVQQVVELLASSRLSFSETRLVLQKAWDLVESFTVVPLLIL